VNTVKIHWLNMNWTISANWKWNLRPNKHFCLSG